MELLLEGFRNLTQDEMIDWTGGYGAYGGSSSGSSYNSTTSSHNFSSNNLPPCPDDGGQYTWDSSSQQWHQLTPPGYDAYEEVIEPILHEIFTAGATYLPFIESPFTTICEYGEDATAPE